MRSIYGSGNCFRRGAGNTLYLICSSLGRSLQTGMNLGCESWSLKKEDRSIPPNTLPVLMKADHSSRMILYTENILSRRPLSKSWFWVVNERFIEVADFRFIASGMIFLPSNWPGWRTFPSSDYWCWWKMYHMTSPPQFTSPQKSA
jgi:hypothetical protein